MHIDQMEILPLIFGGEIILTSNIHKKNDLNLHQRDSIELNLTNNDEINHLMGLTTEEFLQLQRSGDLIGKLIIPRNNLSNEYNNDFNFTFELSDPVKHKKLFQTNNN